MTHYQAEAVLVFRGSYEGAHHGVLDIRITNREPIHLIQPKQKPTDVRIAAQVTGVLGKDKRPVVLGINEGSIVDRIRLQVVVRHAIENRTATARIEGIDQGLA